ncbi:MAG: transporter substrate-binding domain-containing protein [Cohaesibacteraceae bacterium]|nr:transporter substrate-binding domain-containing protein [Cohaesibacteraceae bacterium]
MNKSKVQSLPGFGGLFLVMACLFLAGLTFGTKAEVRILTEDYAPYNYVKDGELTGIGSDIVAALIKRVGSTSNIEVLPWKRAYDMAINKPNVALFSISRTALREEKFQWVGPLYEVVDYVFVRPDNMTMIHTVADMGQVAGFALQAGGATHQTLTAMKVPKLVPVHNIDKIPQLLLTNRVDAVVISDMAMSHELTKRGLEMTAVKPAAMFGKAGLYLSFSLNTTPEVVNRWKAAYESIKADGTLAKLREKYIPNSEVWAAPQLPGLEKYGYGS